MSYPGELACMYVYVLVKQKPVQPEAEGGVHPCIMIHVYSNPESTLFFMQIVSSVSLVTDGYLPDDGTGRVTGIQHLPDLESVCVATGKGDVILWNTVTEQASS